MSTQAFDVHALLRQADEQKAARAEQLPSVEDCLSAGVQAYLRLKELGWKEAVYCPKDGRSFKAIEFGCGDVFDCIYIGEWPRGSWFAQEAGDLWPARPALFLPTDRSES